MTGVVLNAAQQAAFRSFSRDITRAGAGNPAKALERAERLRRAQAVLTPPMRAMMDLAAAGHTLAAIAGKAKTSVEVIEQAFLAATIRLAAHYEREAV